MATSKTHKGIGYGYGRAIPLCGARAKKLTQDWKEVDCIKCRKELMK